MVERHNAVLDLVVIRLGLRGHHLRLAVVDLLAGPAVGALLSLGVYAVLAVLYAVVGRQMLASVGEPYATAMNQQLRIEATLMLSDGLETRNIIQLQGGLTKAAELPTFNETLFADGRSLLGGLRQRMEALTAAVEAAEPEALGQALERSIELHADGRPYVDRYHLRLAAKKLNAIVQALTLTLTLTLTLALALTQTPSRCGLWCRGAAWSSTTPSCMSCGTPRPTPG